ncbi:MAG: hypothetical protein ACM3MK_02165 [Chitinophagales bacterium]
MDKLIIGIVIVMLLSMIMMVFSLMGKKQRTYSKEELERMKPYIIGISLALIIGGVIFAIWRTSPGVHLSVISFNVIALYVGLGFGLVGQIPSKFIYKFILWIGPIILAFGLSHFVSIDLEGVIGFYSGGFIVGIIKLDIFKDWFSIKK